MNEKFTKLVPMNVNDPLRQDKYQILNGINRLGDLINSVNRDMENRILLVASIIVGAIIGILLTKEYYWIALDLGIFMGIFLLLSLIKEAKDKLKLNKMLYATYINAQQNGIILPGSK